MPTEYYPDNAFYQLMIRILIRCGITDYLSRKTQADIKELGEVTKEIKTIQNLIKKANNSVVVKTQLRYILNETDDPIPSLFNLAKDFISKNEYLKNTASDHKNTPEEIINKLSIDDTIQFLDRPDKSTKILNALVLADSMQIHYAVLDVLAACLTSDDESLMKMWGSPTKIFVRATGAYVSPIDSLLYLACAHGNQAILQSFINDIKSLFTDKQQNESDTQQENQNPLQIKIQLFNQLFLHACKFGHLEIVKILLDSGVNITYSDAANTTGFHLACQNDHYALVKFMLEKNPNFVTAENLSNDIGLNLAIAGGHLSLIDLLLEYKSPISGPASGDNFFNTQPTTLQSTNRIKDKKIKEEIEKKLQRYRADIYAKQSKLISKNRFNSLFLLIPGLIGLILFWPLIVLSANKPLFWITITSLLASFCCGLPIFCIRDFRYRAALERLEQEESQAQENPGETTRLLANNSLIDTYGSLKNTLINDERIVETPREKIPEGKKEISDKETPDQKLAQQNKPSKETTERSKYAAYSEIGVIIKDDSNSSQPRSQSLVNPEDSEFGGIRHHPNGKN